jgi:hypothetical protein
MDGVAATDRAGLYVGGNTESKKRLAAQSRERNQYSSFSQSHVECVAGLRIGQEQGADQDVRIENAVPLRAFQEGIQHLWCKSAALRPASNVIEHLL